MDARLDGLSARIDALQRTMILVGGGLVAGMLATLITVLVALVSTQSWTRSATGPSGPLYILAPRGRPVLRSSVAFPAFRR